MRFGMRSILAAAALAVTAALVAGCGGGKYDYAGRPYEELESLTRSTHPAVRVGAVHALEELAPGEPRAAELLARIAVGGEDRDMVHTAAHGLTNLPGDRLAGVAPILAEGFEAASPFVQERILAAARTEAAARVLLPVVGRLCRDLPAEAKVSTSLPLNAVVGFLGATAPDLPEARALLEHLAGASDPDLAGPARRALGN